MIAKENYKIFTDDEGRIHRVDASCTGTDLSPRSITNNLKWLFDTSTDNTEKYVEVLRVGQYALNRESSYVTIKDNKPQYKLSYAVVNEGKNLNDIISESLEFIAKKQIEIS